MIVAYIDPGAGSMLTQLIIAGALGVVFYIRKIWIRLGDIFNKKKSPYE